MSQHLFEINAYVQRRPHMRDANLEYLFMMGVGVLRQIFDEERVDTSIKTLTLYFPERYMNLVEERSLYDRLAYFCPNLKQLNITTQSVYIIQCTPSSSVRILQSKDEQENGITQESTTGRLWRENAHGYDFSKLQVFGWTK